MPMRVAIIDDRPTNLRIYGQFVSMMGSEFSSECFTNPELALEWLDGNSADLIIVDYRMPEMNGAEFIRRYRVRAKEQVPVIVITAHQDRDCRLAALDAGATGFLQSPVSHVEFRDRALKLLEQRRHTNAILARATSLSEQGDRHDRSSKSMLEQIIDTIPIMIHAADRDGKCLFVNAYEAAFFERDPQEMVGQPLDAIYPPSVAERARWRDRQVLDTGEPIAIYEERMRLGAVDLVLQCNKSPIRNRDGEVMGVLTTAADISARKFAEEHRTHLALHDLLTGLPNRALLAERLRAMVDRCRAEGRTAALLLLDLDRFKVINDTRGHQVGDMLLREVAERLASALDKDDFAARIGGDEFAIILRVDAAGPDISERCARLLREINLPYSVSGADQVIGASVGVSLIPGDSDDPDELLRLADLAMYDAKASGRNSFRFYSPKLNSVAQANAQLESELREALLLDQFALEYQPIMDSRTSRIVGLEALIRFDHPTRGRLQPHDFMRVATDTGLIVAMGAWVVRRACAMLAQLSATGGFMPRIAINVSPRQFAAQDIASLVLGEAAAVGVDPAMIVVEITEELFLDRNPEVTGILTRLRRHGVGISIDDFGTGYSSLQYLRDLPATRLKIDREFVRRIESNATDRAIVGTITHLGHSLGMRIVAEGIETEGQMELLRAAGCDELQGFLIGRPVREQAVAGLFELAGTGTGI